MGEYPRLLHTVIDGTDVRGLAEFYRELLGLRYRPGDEPPADGVADDADWLVLVDDRGERSLAFQQVDSLPRSTWPANDTPMQLHVDFTVTSVSELRRHRDRALALGAEVLLDRTDDEDEPLYVFADPAGHPFCIFVRRAGPGRLTWGRAGSRATPAAGQLGHAGGFSRHARSGRPGHARRRAGAPTPR